MLALNFDGGPVMDAVMWFASGIPNWIPLYLAVLYIVYRNYGWKYMLFALLFVGLGVGLCDQVCNFFKRNVPYLRPTHTEDMLPYLHTVKGYLGGLMGTVSGHASTRFLHLPVHVARRPQAVVYMDDAHLYVAYFLFADIPRRPLAVPDIVRLDTRPARRAADVVPFLPVE